MCCYLVKAVLIRRDNVSEPERLLVSRGVLQHAEQQEDEPGQTEGAQHRHLVAAFGILLRVLDNVQIKNNHVMANLNLIGKGVNKPLI